MRWIGIVLPALVCAGCSLGPSRSAAPAERDASPDLDPAGVVAPEIAAQKVAEPESVVVGGEQEQAEPRPGVPLDVLVAEFRSGGFRDRVRRAVELVSGHANPRFEDEALRDEIWDWCVLEKRLIESRTKVSAATRYVEVVLVIDAYDDAWRRFEAEFVRHAEHEGWAGVRLVLKGQDRVEWFETEFGSHVERVVREGEVFAVRDLPVRR